MNYKLGNSKYLKDLGITQEQTCPICKETVSFPVYKNPNFEVTASFPFFDDDAVYFTLCPSCKQNFRIPHALGSAYEKGDKWAVRSCRFEDPKPYKK